MKSSKIIFPFLLIFTLLLSACGGANNRVGGTPAVDFGTAYAIPETGGTLAATQPPAGTLAAAPATAATQTVPATSTLPAVTQSSGGTTPATGTLAAGNPTSAATTGTPAAGTPAAGSPTAGNPAVTDQPGGLLGIPASNPGWVGLAAMLDFTVQDASGELYGEVQDYVINLCEAHLLYIVVNPTNPAGNTTGRRVLIPYEAALADPNGGEVDVNEGVIRLNISASDLRGAPVLDLETLDMVAPSWDADAMAYWTNHFRLEQTAGCQRPGRTATSSMTAVPGGTGTAAATGTPQATAAATAAATSAAGQPGAEQETAYGIATATDLLAAKVEDGTGGDFGRVRDVAVAHETGFVPFVLVEEGTQPGGARPGNDRRVRVALPAGAVNVRYNQGSKIPVLVLAVEALVVMNSPEFGSSAGQNEGEWFDYWEQHIPMTPAPRP